MGSSKREAERDGWIADPAGVYFSDRFGVHPDTLSKWALDISIVADMPLFIDPFLLFNSDRSEYQALHEQILDYLRFLRDKAVHDLSPGLVNNWYAFREVKQNWLGFTVDGNAGHGLGSGFARALHGALGSVLENFGSETVTQTSHLEKLALIHDGVGRDNISDFTTNLIKHFLLSFTEKFARRHLKAEYCRRIAVPRAVFNYKTETWASRTYTLPWTNGDFVLLTPIDLLTKDDTWINKNDMVNNFDHLPAAVPDDQLRAQINNYLLSRLSRNPTNRDIREARVATLREFPELIDYYIKLKEDDRDTAAAVSLDKTQSTQRLLRDQVQLAAADIASKTDLFKDPWTSFDEAAKAVSIFKKYVEDQDGYKVINRGGGKPFANEAEVHGFFGLLLQWSRFDVNREANNGRGPVDFKLSEGAFDKSLIEFKLASSTSLKRNLRNQIEIYEKANNTNRSLKVIICYTAAEQVKVAKVLKELGLDSGERAKSVTVVDARSDNKTSASKA